MNEQLNALARGYAEAGEQAKEHGPAVAYGWLAARVVRRREFRPERPRLRRAPGSSAGRSPVPSCRRAWRSHRRRWR